MKAPAEKDLSAALSSTPKARRKAGDTSVIVLPRATLPTRSPRDWRAMQWLTLGIGIKRWALIVLIGVAMAALGTALSLAYVAVDLSLTVVDWVNRATNQLINTEVLGVVILTGGVLLVAIGVRGTFRAVERAYATSPNVNADFLETALRRRKLEHSERVVAIGGGTGLSTMLRGLKEYTSNITAVVTMADDGGSSGMLREHGMLPPGDLRNCIAALAEAEPLMTNLFQYRFQGLGPLKGHSVGNLIVAAMCEMTGDFESAVRETSKVLAIRGRVLPSTLEDVRLGAILEDGTQILGQSAVNKADKIKQVFLQPEAPHALPDVVKAIAEADVIIIGPGSLFTSIIPNLLVPEIAAAIKASQAPKIYVCNMMTQPNETADFKASDHVKALVRHIGRDVISLVLMNNGTVHEDVLARYRNAGADYVEPDQDTVALLGVRPILGNFMDATNVVRHNPQRLASAIFRIIARL